MARFEISLTVSYVSSWGVWEGLREIVQNAHDGEIEHGAKMSAQHTGKVLKIKNEGAALPREALLIGYSTKSGSRDMIGQFGEGLKLGTLALIRAGLGVRIKNGEEVWTPQIVASEKYNADVLAFDVTKSRAKNPQKELSVEITGLDYNTWEEMSKNFLFLQKEIDGIDTIRGRLLLDEEYKGRLYVKGILVEKSTYRYGYDFKHAMVDRDRTMVNHFDRKWEASRILSEAVTKDTAHKEALMESINELLQQGKDEVDNIGSFPGKHEEVIRKGIYEKFKETYGKDSVPVRTMSESREVEMAGKRGIVMPDGYVNMIEPLAGNAEKIKEEAEKEQIVRLSWTDLTEQQKDVFERAINIVGDATGVRESSLLSIVDIVKFPPGSEDIQGRYLNNRCLVSVNNLSSIGLTVGVIAHEFAHSLGYGDGTAEHVSFMWHTMGKIIDNMLELEEV